MNKLRAQLNVILFISMNFCKRRFKPLLKNTTWQVMVHSRDAGTLRAPLVWPLTRKGSKINNCLTSILETKHLKLVICNVINFSNRTCLQGFSISFLVFCLYWLCVVRLTVCEIHWAAELMASVSYLKTDYELLRTLLSLSLLDVIQRLSSWIKKW